MAYKNILNPNDWVFLFVDPLDGERSIPLFLGFIDSIFPAKKISPDGTISQRVQITCSGWEKAIQNVSAITSPFVHGNINVASLLALGPFGWMNEGRTTRRTAYALPGVGAGVGADISIGSGNVGLYTMELPYLIETLVALFLRNDSSEGLDPSQFSDSIRRAASVDNDEDITPLFNGQFELPGTNKPLWDFIRMRFQNIQQRTYVDPRMFLNGTTRSLASLIDSLSNPLLNEIFYDVRRTDEDGLSSMDNQLVGEVTGGYSSENMRNFISFAREANEQFGEIVENVAPYMVFRERPLASHEIIALDGPTMDEREFISIDLGKSDSDLHNLVSLEIPGIQMQLIRAQTGFMGFTDDRTRSLESIRRHGLRFYSDQASAWPMTVRGVNIEAPIPSPELLEVWERRMTQAGLDNPYIYSGSVVIPKYIRGLNIGSKLIIQHQTDVGVEVEEGDRVYYVDGYDWNFTGANGSFVKSIHLSRGYPTEVSGGSSSHISQTSRWGV